MYLEDFPQQILSLGEKFNANVGDIFSMVGNKQSILNDDTKDNNPYAIGGKRSWVPILGDKVWELPEETYNRIPYSAYISKINHDQLIGYVRIPNYTYNKRVANEFGKLVAHFETSTSAMVLDQINNYGGSMYQMYSILSYLTDRSLALPMHQITISDEDVEIAREKLSNLNANESEPSSEFLIPEEISYYRFVISEYEAGRAELTNPTYLLGISKIKPANQHYTKKIIVLINELDFYEHTTSQ